MQCQPKCSVIANDMIEFWHIEHVTKCNGHTL